MSLLLFSTVIALLALCIADVIYYFFFCSSSSLSINERFKDNERRAVNNRIVC